MMTLTTEQLDQLTREELLELLKQLLPLVAEVERLGQRIEELEAENKRLRNQSTRSAAEITTVMGSLCLEAWVCDCFGAQLKAPAKVFQLCLAHQLRDMQRALDANPRCGGVSSIAR